MFDAVTNNIGFLMGGFLVTLELTCFALVGGHLIYHFRGHLFR